MRVPDQKIKHFRVYRSVHFLNMTEVFGFIQRNKIYVLRIFQVQIPQTFSVGCKMLAWALGYSEPSRTNFLHFIALQ